MSSLAVQTREHAVVLLAEDDEDYVLLIRRAFLQAQIPNPLFVVSDGQQAMSYLKGEGRFADREEFPLPDLLLLDLKLPRFSGFEVLAWVRTQPGFSGLRVLVLTSSDRIKDVNDAYRLGANSFLVKPFDFWHLVYFTNLIQEFWLKRCKSPETSRSSNESEDQQPENPQIAGEGNP